MPRFPWPCPLSTWTRKPTEVSTVILLGVSREQGNVGGFRDRVQCLGLVGIRVISYMGII